MLNLYSLGKPDDIMWRDHTSALATINDFTEVFINSRWFRWLYATTGCCTSHDFLSRHTIFLTSYWATRKQPNFQISPVDT